MQKIQYELQLIAKTIFNNDNNSNNNNFYKCEFLLPKLCVS